MRSDVHATVHVDHVAGDVPRKIVGSEEQVGRFPEGRVLFLSPLGNWVAPFGDGFPSFRRESTGFRVSWGYPIVRDLTLFLGYNLEYVTVGFGLSF